MSSASSDAWWKCDAGDTFWMDDAICRQVDPELWHPGKGENNKVREAKRVCFKCPVRSECLRYAMRQPGIGGILGGTTERERRAIKANREKRRQERVGV